MKNQMIELMMMMMIELSMDMEITRMSSQMSIWRCKIHNTQRQSGTDFHHICR